MKPLPLAWIPNEAGFEFWGVRPDQTLVMCSVVLGPDFLHRIKEIPLSDLIGWYRIK